MKNFITEAVILAIGLSIMGGRIKSGLSDNRYVTVKGLAEKEVPANRVTWPLAYKLLGNNLNDLYQDINKTNATIIQLLKEAGIEVNEIIMNAPEVYDLKADRYGNPKDIVYRYNLTNVITVKSSKIDIVRQLIENQSVFLKKGIALLNDYGHQVKYEYTNLNDIKPQMIEEATKNARIAAEKFAKDSDSKIGKIQTANQGQFSIADSDETTPHIKNIRVVTSIKYALRD